MILNKFMKISNFTTKFSIGEMKIRKNNTTKASEVLGIDFLSCLILHKSNVQTADESDVPAEVEKCVTD